MAGLGWRNDAAAKGGVEASMRALAAECEPPDVTCNAIAPGPFATDSNRKFANDTSGDFMRKVLLRRFGQPRGIAWTALFLARDAPSFMNAAAIVVDVGLTAAI